MPILSFGGKVSIFHCPHRHLRKIILNVYDCPLQNKTFKGFPFPVGMKKEGLYFFSDLKGLSLGSCFIELLGDSKTEAVFLVMYDPSMNKL